MSNNRPKLELQLNQPTKVKLLKEHPYKGSGPYGEYLLFSVEHEGVEKAFFVQNGLTQKINDLDIHAGDILTLVKTVTQNGKKIVTDYQVSKEITNSEPQRPSPPMGDNLKSLMESSLRDAVEIVQSITNVPFQTADVQKIATSMFIERIRMNRVSNF